MLAQWWERVTVAQAPLDWRWALAMAGVALVLAWSPAGYRLVRHLVTLVHEAGHALIAVLAGRRLRGIRLHSDTSGVTLSRGKPRGPGMVLTLAAGYPAPAVVGLAGAWLLGAGYAAGWLWLLVLTCALMLLLIRNLYGLWVVLATGVAVAALSWMAAPVVLQCAAHLAVWSLLLAAPRSVVELQRQRRRILRRYGGPRGDRSGWGGRSGRSSVPGMDSDVDQLGRLTGVPAVVWTGLFWLLCVGCLAGSGWILFA
ncbi:M50 family metallopeptidase [Citricoccus sp. GCM10030269]|uniref:M50 family metallopeptidase n=1 Tax=Citricoccus sp. GCM10030269 TaxID=3273388 RepID=UPI0036097B2F